MKVYYEEAKKIFDMICSDKEKFDLFPENRYWGLLLLNVGMELYYTDTSEQIKEELKKWAKEIFNNTQIVYKLECFKNHTLLEHSINIGSKPENGILTAFLLVYLNLKGASNSEKRIQYLDKKIKELTKEIDLAQEIDLAHILYYLRGELPSDKYTFIDKLVNSWDKESFPLEYTFSEILLKYSLITRYKQVNLKNFELKQKELSDFFSRDLSLTAEKLGTAYSEIIKKATRDFDFSRDFRIGIIGEFKTGKSTFINALLRKTLLPTDILPCTSCIIEIKYGAKEEYYEVSLNGDKISKTKDEFIQNAGQANTIITRLKHIKDKLISIDKESLKVKRWEINISSPFFSKNNSFILIDTPGIGEDPIRSELARMEAKFADAAVLILNAQRLMSELELKMIDEMGNKSRGLLIVINKIDNIPEKDLNKLREHVVAKVKEFNIEKDQIVLLSAQKAVEEIQKEEVKESKWLNLLESFEIRLQERILQNTAGIRIGNIKEICNKMKVEILSAINKQNEMLAKSTKEIETEKKEVEEKKRNAEESVNSAFKKLKDETAENVKNKFTTLFIDDWNKTITDLYNKKNNWESKKNPIFSPEAFAKEISQQAMVDLINLIETWGDKIKPDLERKFKEGIEQCEKDFNIIADYLVKTKGANEELYKKELLGRAFKDAFRDISETDIGVSVFGHTFLAVIVSSVIGYVVADIILYYILSIISGFLNPILLAAAAVVALATFAVGGLSFIKEKVRDKIAREIVNKLLDKDMEREIRTAITTELIEKLTDFAKEFKKNASDLIKEAEFHYKEAINKYNSEQEKQNEFKKCSEEIKLLLIKLEEKINFDGCIPKI